MRYIYVRSYLLLFFNLLWTAIGYAQPALSPAQQHDSLDREYQIGKIKKSEYLILSTELIQTQSNQGISYESGEMLRLMRLYKKIAWSDDSLSKSRITYYTIMANNARLRNRGGEALYYFDKADKQSEARGVKPLYALRQRVAFFSDNENNVKVIQVYKANETYIRSMPELIRKDSIKNLKNANVFGVLECVCIAYAKMQDTAGVSQTLAIAEQIREALNLKVDPNTQEAVLRDFAIGCMYCHQADILLKDRVKSRQALNNLRHILERESELSPQLRAVLEVNWFHYEVEHYLEIKNNDSAGYYLGQIRASDASAGVNNYLVTEYEARLLANKSNFKGAYFRMEDAVKGRDSIITQLTEEMDNLLYAYTEAENNREELLLSDQQKRKKNMIILLISVSGLLIVALIYNLMKRKERISRKKIEELNHMAELQIAEMEEVKLSERQAEQRRLGMDLHDNLASHLAGIKHQIEVFSFKFEDAALRRKLSGILQQVDTAYESTRKKSHEWVLFSKEDSEHSFEERINFLADRIFPDHKFKKSIEVDTDALELVSVEIKIVVLRIIQEAMINIVKHAHADEIMILIYEEEPHLVLRIGDNGRGFNTEKLKGKSGHLGLESMQEQVAKAKGTFKIESGKGGTVIIVRIPVAGT